MSKVARCCWALVLFAGLSASLQAQEYTLEQVTRGYRDSIAALKTVYMRCEWKRTPTEMGAGLTEGGKPLLAPFYRTVDWAIDGPKYHYHVLFDGVKDDKSMQKWRSYDGKNVWWLEIERDSDPEKFVSGFYMNLAKMTDNDLRQGTTPGQFLGLYIAIGEELQTRDSISSLLKNGNPQLIGIEEINGHLCVHVDTTYTTPKGDDFKISVWFDPGVGFLPRKIINYFLFSEKSVPASLVVSEFSSTVDANGNSVWYPKVMTREGSLTSEIISVESLLIRGLDPALFKPNVPSDVPIYDYNKPSEMERARMDRIKPGLEKARAERNKALAESKANKSVPLPQKLESTSVIALPRAGWTGAMIALVLAAGASLAAVFRVMVRR